MLYSAQKSTVPILSQFCPMDTKWIQFGYKISDSSTPVDESEIVEPDDTVFEAF